MKVWLAVVSWGKEITIKGAFSTEDKAKERVLAVAIDDDATYAGYHVAEINVDEEIEGIGWEGSE